jgi:uncharacterized protein
MNHIGIDFDDTLVDMRKSIVEVLNKIHDKNINYEEVTEYGVSSLYNYSFKDFQTFFTDNQSELHAIKPNSLLKTTLDELGAEYKLTVITGRPNEWIHSAAQWITKHDLPILDIVCVSNYKKGKAECAAALKVSHFIEDRANDALSIADAGINVFLLDKPYNRDCRHARITRVRDWDEIKALLMR